MVANIFTHIVITRPWHFTAWGILQILPVYSWKHKYQHIAIQHALAGISAHLGNIYKQGVLLVPCPGILII